MCCGWNYHQYSSSTSRVSLLFENWINELPWQGLEEQQGSTESRRGTVVLLCTDICCLSRSKIAQGSSKGAQAVIVSLQVVHYVFEVTLWLVPHLLHIGSHWKMVSKHTNCIGFCWNQKGMVYYSVTPTGHQPPMGAQASRLFLSRSSLNRAVAAIAFSAITGLHTNALLHCLHDFQCRQLQAFKGILVGTVEAVYAQTCTLKKPFNRLPHKPRGGWTPDWCCDPNVWGFLFWFLFVWLTPVRPLSHVWSSGNETLPIFEGFSWGLSVGRSQKMSHTVQGCKDSTCCFILNPRRNIYITTTPPKDVQALMLLHSSSRPSLECNCVLLFRIDTPATILAPCPLLASCEEHLPIKSDLGICFLPEPATA